MITPRVASTLSSSAAVAASTTPAESSAAAVAAALRARARAVAAALASSSRTMGPQPRLRRSQPYHGSSAAAVRRRTRVFYEDDNYKNSRKNQSPNSNPSWADSSAGGGRAVPHDPSAESYDEYLKKVTLSPWVPVPEVVARRGLDLAKIDSRTFHADLGSGDGRVCFLAVDAYGARRSLGVDVDPTVLQMANDRLRKRHPPPANLEFVEGDLLDASSPAWDLLFPSSPPDAASDSAVSVLTLHFATPALELLRPVLELKLVGRACRVVSFGYEIPGWGDPFQSEVVLGTQIHLYEWGTASTTTSSSSSMNLLDAAEDRGTSGADPYEETLGFTDPGLQLRETRSDMAAAASTSSSSSLFEGSRIVDRTGLYPIRGYNPDIFDKEEPDTSDDDEEEDEPKSGEEHDNDEDNDNDEDDKVKGSRNDATR